MATKPVISDTAFADFLKAKYKQLGTQTPSPKLPQQPLPTANIPTLPRTSPPKLPQQPPPTINDATLPLTPSPKLPQQALPNANIPTLPQTSPPKLPQQPPPTIKHVTLATPTPFTDSHSNISSLSTVQFANCKPLKKEITLDQHDKIRSTQVAVKKLVDPQIAVQKSDTANVDHGPVDDEVKTPRHNAISDIKCAKVIAGEIGQMPKGTSVVRDVKKIEPVPDFESVKKGPIFVAHNAENYRNQTGSFLLGKSSEGTNDNSSDHKGFEVIEEAIGQITKGTGFVGDIKKLGPVRGVSDFDVVIKGRPDTTQKVIPATKPQLMTQNSSKSSYKKDGLGKPSGDTAQLILIQTQGEEAQEPAELKTVFDRQTLATASVDGQTRNFGDPTKTPRLRRRINLEQILKQKLKIEVSSPPATSDMIGDPFATSGNVGRCDFELPQKLASASFLRQLDIERTTRLALQCPVCFDLLQPPIYRCAQGHSVCPRCLPCLTLCTTCQQVFTKQRRADLEERCLAILVQCRWCEVAVPAVLYEAHAQVCEISGVDL